LVARSLGDRPHYGLVFATAGAGSSTVGDSDSDVGLRGGLSGATRAQLIAAGPRNAGGAFGGGFVIVSVVVGCVAVVVARGGGVRDGGGGGAGCARG
jgi:hypothetical protein